MWRIATAADDERIVSMCMALNADDPGSAPVPPHQVRRENGVPIGSPTRIWSELRSTASVPSF